MRSCLAGQSSGVGVMEEKNRRGDVTSHFISVGQSLSLTGPLCFLLMNSPYLFLKGQPGCFCA